MVNVLVTYTDGTILTWVLQNRFKLSDLLVLIGQRGKVRGYVISGITKVN